MKPILKDALKLKGNSKALSKAFSGSRIRSQRDKVISWDTLKENEKIFQAKDIETNGKTLVFLDKCFWADSVDKGVFYPWDKFFAVIAFFKGKKLKEILECDSHTGKNKMLDKYFVEDFTYAEVWRLNSYSYDPNRPPPPPGVKASKDDEATILRKILAKHDPEFLKKYAMLL